MSKTFGEFIREKREAAGVTQEECAKAIGWHNRASYHKIEAGKLEWKLRDFITIARLIGCEPSELLSEWTATENSPRGQRGE